MTTHDEQSRARLRRLLDELDFHKSGYTGPERRLETRLSYRKITKPTRFVPVSGDRLVTPTVTRNLCSKGVALLHKPFVYPGSTLAVTLAPLKGPEVTLTGVVLTCRYTSDGYHESSVRLDQRIETGDFITASEQDAPEKHLDRVRRRLDGLRILLIDPTGRLYARLLGSFEALGAKVSVVRDLGKALDQLRTGPVDLLFCGHAQDRGDASQIVRLCRDSGYLRPIIAMGWPPTQLAKARALQNAGVIASIDPESEDQAMEILGTLDLKPLTQRAEA